MRERSFITPRSGIDITTFGEGEEFRTVSNPSSQFKVGCGSSPGHALHPFLLALHTNLAADEAKLGVCCAYRGGDTGGRPGCMNPRFQDKVSHRLSCQ